MASRVIPYRGQNFNLSYEIVNPASKQTILILHGWGSNKEIMKQAFGKKFPHFRHLYVDMPGFGRSDNKMILTTENYAQIMRLFLNDLGIEPMIAIGHSFGGKVSTLLKTPVLVLLSSSGIQVPKQTAVKVKIALFKILKPLKLDRLHQLLVSDDAKGMPQNMYETFKNVVNEDFEHNFPLVSAKALLFWGKEDTATPLYSGEKIATLIQDSQFYPLEGDHFFFLKHADFIEEKILASL